MMVRRKTPSFARPPVIEVALGVQFRETLPLKIVDYGVLWEQFKDRYPELQEQGPLSRVVESFGDEPRPSQKELVNSTAFPKAPVRLWFANSDSGGLVQVQADRFVFNWRKTGPESEYPRFAWLQERFREEYGTFLTFLADRGMEAPYPDICDVTYVNHIVGGEGWTGHANLHAVFPTLQIPSVTLDGVDAEEADVRIRFATVGVDGQPGRLHFRTYPAVRNTDGAKLLVVNFIARRRPAHPSVEDILEALHDGHDWIVMTFKDVTSADMHKVWGLEDAGS